MKFWQDLQSLKTFTLKNIGYTLACDYTIRTHGVNTSYSYEMQEDIICRHINALLEDVGLL